MYSIKLINNTYYSSNNYKDIVNVAKQNLVNKVYDSKNDKIITLNYNITFYTIYNKCMQLVGQVDNLQEVASKLQVKYNYLRKAISTGQLINNCFYVISDTIKIDELYK